MINLNGLSEHPGQPNGFITNDLLYRGNQNSILGGYTSNVTPFLGNPNMNLLSSTSITKVAPALLKAQLAMGDAKKGSSNPFFKSNYADLNSIREAAIPVLNAVGITVLQPMTTVGDRSFVRTLLLHESGEWLASDTEIVAPKQNDPQAHGSGISYARRYGLQSLLNIGAVDDDGEAAMGRTKAPVKQAPAVTPSAVTATAPVLGAASLPAQVVTLTGDPLPVGAVQAEAPKKSSFRKQPKAEAPVAVSTPAEEKWE